MLGRRTTNGLPITIDDRLRTDVLRRRWGHHGLLITDWDNVGRAVWEQNAMPSYKSPAAAAVNAGVGMVMTTPQFYQGALDALEEGLISEDRLDEAVARLLTLKLEMGLFEYPVTLPRTPERQLFYKYLRWFVWEQLSGLVSPRVALAP